MSDTHAAPADQDEPQSPPWLPALGLALFVVAGIAWSLCTGSSGSAQAGSPAASVSAAAAH